MRVLPLVLLLGLLPLLSVLAACGGSGGRTVVVDARTPRPVSIQVEVYDPATNWVWENVGVRIVEADQEWSSCTCASPYQDWYFTDAAGQVLLDEYVLAAAEVGFVTDGLGRAQVLPRSFEDEVTVVLEIDAVGFTPIIVEVPLNWNVPDVFVAVPFN